MILNVSAYLIYETFFSNKTFCARKGKCEVNHLEHVVVFCKQTAKGAITVNENITVIYKYVGT